MNCNPRLLHLYVDDGGKGLAAMLLKEHLKSCSACRRELVRLKALDWDLRHRPGADAPAELGTLRRRTLDACFMESGTHKEISAGIASLLSLPAGIWQGSTAFVSCLPGISALQGGVRRRREPAPRQSALRSLLRLAMGHWEVTL